MKNMKNLLSKRVWEVLGSIAMLALFVGPFLTFASHRDSVYVDSSAKKSGNGSMEKPYSSISEALNHANDRTDVHVANGTYHEKITIPTGVKVFGSDQNKVEIMGTSDDKPVVTMKNNTEINKVTISKGGSGILVKENTRVSIVECTIKDNDADGVKVEAGTVSDKKKVSITKSTIRNNGKSGIYSHKRRLILINNDISDNDKDGIDLDGGSAAWIEKNDIKFNGGDGMKFTLDGSDVWTKNNNIRGNKREGIEVNAYGATGRVDVNKSKLSLNGGFGVARVQRKNFSASVWNGLTVQESSTYTSNKAGEISAVKFLLQ